MVNSNGGHSIGVYNADTQDKAKVYKMMREGRIRYFAPSDYSEGSQLAELVKAIIDRTVTNEKLEEIHFRCKRENIEADKQSSEEGKAKTDLLIALENSRSFARTHEIVKKLRQHGTWSHEETEQLCYIAVNNSQVKYIIGDADVKQFYSRVLKNAGKLTEDMAAVKEMLENEG